LLVLLLLLLLGRVGVEALIVQGEGKQQKLAGSWVAAADQAIVMTAVGAVSAGAAGYRGFINASIVFAGVILKRGQAVELKGVKYCRFAAGYAPHACHGGCLRLGTPQGVSIMMWVHVSGTLAPL
jgi:hypothetical protein